MKRKAGGRQCKKRKRKKGKVISISYVGRLNLGKDSIPLQQSDQKAFQTLLARFLPGKITLYSSSLFYQESNINILCEYTDMFIQEKSFPLKINLWVRAS